MFNRQIAFGINDHNHTTTGQAGELKPYGKFAGATLQMDSLHLNVPLPVPTSEDKVKTSIINLCVENVSGTFGSRAPQLTGKAGHEAMNEDVLDVGRNVLLARALRYVDESAMSRGPNLYVDIMRRRSPAVLASPFSP